MLIATCPLIINASGCQSNPDAPKLQVKVPLFAADARTQSVVRQGSPNTVIRCSDPRFDDMICTTREAYSAALKEISNASYQCEKWRGEETFVQSQEGIE